MSHCETKCETSVKAWARQTRVKALALYTVNPSPSLAPHIVTPQETDPEYPGV